MLIEIANLWNEVLALSIASYGMALIFLAGTCIATKTMHLIVGAVMALVTGFFSQISKIMFNISMVLVIARMLLFFI